MNTWQFVNGDVVLSSEDDEQLKLADMWLKNLIQAIRIQVLEEVIHGRSIVPTDSESGQQELFN